METCKNISEFLEVIRRVEALTDESIDISFSTSEVTIFKTESYFWWKMAALIGESAERVIRGKTMDSELTYAHADIDLLVIDRLFNELDGSDYVFKVDIDKHGDKSGEWFSIDFVYTEK